MISSTRLVVFACTAALHSSPALAGRPLQTEDAGVLEPGACEIEGATHRLSAAGERSTESHIQWGCGIGWTSQIAVAASKACAPVAWRSAAKPGCGRPKARTIAPH